MRFSTLLLATSAIAVGASPASAQEQPAPNQVTQGATRDVDEVADQGGIGDIVVTARRRSESLQNVPLSVTGIATETLQQRDITTIDRLQGLAPGLTIRNTSGPTTSGILVNIRGIGGSDATGTTDYPIATYVDGVLIARPNAALFDLVDLERVEILRGPQGTLFGRNTTGGAINITTAQPSRYFGIEQRVTYGTYDLFKARTTLDTGEIGSSGIAMKFAYSHIGQDGYVPNSIKTNSAPVGQRRSDSGYVAINGDFRALQVDLRADYSKAHNSPVLQQLAYINPLQFAYFSQSPNYGGDPLVVTPEKPEQTAIANQPRGRNENYGGSATVSYEFSPAFSLKSITGYRNFSEAQAVNNGGQGVLRGPVVGGGIERVYLFDYPTPAVATDRTFTQELQASGDVGDFNYVVGLYYFHERYTSKTTQNFTFVLSPTSALNFLNVRDYVQRAKSYAAFGQVSYSPGFAPGLELTGGLRYTKDKKTIRQANRSNGNALAPGFASDEWDDLSWTASATYRFSPQLMTYARVATAYRAGGFDAGGAGDPNRFDPEKVKSYEVGFKADVLDRTLRANASVYYTDYSDLQISQFVAGTGGGQTRTVNAGKAAFSGFELELTAAPTDDFTLTAAVGYVFSDYKTYIFIDPVTNQPINVADEVHNAHVPDWTGNLNADVIAARFDDAKLRLNVGYEFQASAYNFPLDRVNPFNPFIRTNTLSNLTARITLEDFAIGDRTRLTLQAYGENLLDQDVRFNAVDFGSLGFATLAWAEGRRFGITATVRY